MNTRVADTVVVAVDGSAESAAALRWAAAEATRAGLALRIVTAYQQPHVTSDTAGAYWDHTFAVEDAARSHAADTIARVLDIEACFDPVVACGSVESLLRAHSTDAALIVIGTRRKDTWYHEVRGSVTNRITGSVSCPVVSIPLPAPDPQVGPVMSGSEMRTL